MPELSSNIYIQIDGWFTYCLHFLYLCCIGPLYSRLGCRRDNRHMALLITDECINCDVCEPECPNEAIYLGELIYEIDPGKCTECVGHFDEPQCVQVCPVACIPVNPQHIESRETLMQKYLRLMAQGSAAV